MLDLRDPRTPKNAKKKSPAAAPAGVEDPRLETTVKSVGQFSRFQLFRHQRHAAALLGKKHKVGLCKWSVTSISDGVSVKLRTHENGGKTAYYEGLQTCASVWVCPCCGNKISGRRRDEMNRLLKWARETGHQVFMVTLTARHGIDDDLPALLEAMKVAKKRMHQHRAWRALKGMIVGSVTATEVTYGQNGWHPHYHMILVVRDDQGDDVEDEDEENPRTIEGKLSKIKKIWLASLEGVGLSGTGDGFDLRNASGTKSYIAKWGAAEELTLNRHKKGRRSGRTPAQLLADSCDRGDKLAGALWVHFTEVFKGRRQLVWSRGLKALAGIDEVEDTDAAAGDPELVAMISRSDWSGDDVAARRRRGAILNAAEMTPSSVSDVIYDADSTDADYERELRELEDEAVLSALLENDEHRSEITFERAQVSIKIGREPELQHLALPNVKRGSNRIFVDTEHDQNSVGTPLGDLT